MSTKELQEKMLANLKKWQKIENASVSSTGHMLEKTDHPLIRLVLETIQADSRRHYHTQQLILDSMTVKSLSLQPEDVAEIWDLIEKHQELEQETIRVAEEILKDTEFGSHLTAQHYLIRYLLEGEKKHNFMLDALEKVKKDMYPYA
ncbi:hypothetical protein K8I28_12760 [bacterium]|nr:hypothetical protein [bacterium]